MENELFDLNRKLNALSVFRSILGTEVVSSLQKLLYAIEKSSTADQLWYYGAFSKALYERGGSLSLFVKEFILEDQNLYLIKKTENEEVSHSIEECLSEELIVLQELANLTTPQVKKLINFDGYLPGWDTTPIDLKKEYQDMIANISTRGYGIFAKYKAFQVDGGKLVPVKNVDPKTIDQLYGYQRERGMVLDNTKALAEGKAAVNVLLYGDAGTGKSSTIKACANAYYDKGVRLVEFDKSQLTEIPMVMDQLYQSPLKFIFFIDDLSFSQDDDSFCQLKAILEGNIASYARNVVIYATSNRRHLIRESMESRMGNDLHLNDTLQETMSLSARFGLTITFSKPEKDLYLEIVSCLAKEYGVEMEQEELFRRAEAFAIRASGRSPRTAKQFIQRLTIGL